MQPISTQGTGPIPADFHPRNVYVAGIPSSFTEEALQSLFSRFGPIESCKMMRGVAYRENNRQVAFVMFQSATSATSSIEEMNGAEIEGTPWTVRRARLSAPPGRERKSDRIGGIDGAFSPAVAAGAPAGTAGNLSSKVPAPQPFLVPPPSSPAPPPPPYVPAGAPYVGPPPGTLLTAPPGASPIPPAGVATSVPMAMPMYSYVQYAPSPLAGGATAAVPPPHPLPTMTAPPHQPPVQYQAGLHSAYQPQQMAIATAPPGGYYTSPQLAVPLPQDGAPPSGPSYHHLGLERQTE